MSRKGKYSIVCTLVDAFVLNSSFPTEWNESTYALKWHCHCRIQQKKIMNLPSRIMNNQTIL